MITNKNILITGATGSLGTNLIPVFLNANNKIIGLSRDFHKQRELKDKINNNNLSFVIGDIRNKDLLLDICQEVDIVIHTAALKSVEVCENNKKEAMSINVIGSLNVAEACRITGVKKALFISSDKEAMPVIFYGFCKALASKLWLAQNTPYRETKFSALRYGNVLSSNSSVWNIWKQNIEKGLPIIVKRPEPTRFILHMQQAIAMIMKSLEIMNGNEIFVPGKVPAFSIWDLALEMQPDKSKWIMEDLIPSEKVHEYMVASTEYIEPATEDFMGINLWKIDNKKVPISYEVPPMFYSQEARRITGKQVLELLEKQYEI